MDPGTFGASVGILYNVTWFPNTPEALQKVPEGIQKLAAKAPMQTTLMVSSNPLVDGAACGGEYNARACAASSLAATPEAEERLWREERFRLGDRATAPGNQTCDEKSVVGELLSILGLWAIRLTSCFVHSRRRGRKGERVVVAPFSAAKGSIVRRQVALSLIHI